MMKYIMLRNPCLLGSLPSGLHLHLSSRSIGSDVPIGVHGRPALLQQLSIIALSQLWFTQHRVSFIYCNESLVGFRGLWVCVWMKLK